MTEIVSVRLPNPTPVAAGSVAVLNIPNGNTINKIDLNYAGVTLAQMESITLKIDGNIIQQFGTGTEHDRNNKFDGIAAASGILRFEFERKGLMRPENRIRTLLGTHFKTSNGEQRKWKTMQLEIKLAAGAAAPVLSATAEQSPPRVMDVVRRRLQFTYDLAAGENHVSNLPMGSFANARIERIFFDSANLTNVEVRKNNATIFERTKAQNEFCQNNGEAGRTPQTDLVVVDTSEDGFGGNTINTLDANDFRALLTLSGAESITVTVDYLGTLY